MAWFRSVLAGLGCWAVWGGAQAAPLLLQAAQMKNLGIELQVPGGAAQGGSAVPARVIVPNAQMRVVAAPVAGLVEQLLVAPGSVVRKGQVLARLASPQALALQRDALQAGSQSALLQQNLKRDEQLFAEGLIAESRLQASRSAAAQADALASERRQGAALAGLVPGKSGLSLALTAPLDGVVLEQGAQTGQRVEEAALIYRIAQLSPLWLEIQVPLDVAASLQPGQSVTLSGSGVRGKLLSVGRAVDPASQSVLVRAEVSQGAEKLIPGQMVAVDLGRPGGGVGVPTSAVIRHAGESLVFVRTGGDAQSMQFEARPVKILQQGAGALVVDGVKRDESIAVKGVSGLKAMLTGVGKE